MLKNYEKDTYISLQAIFFTKKIVKKVYTINIMVWTKNENNKYYMTHINSKDCLCTQLPIRPSANTQAKQIEFVLLQYNINGIQLTQDIMLKRNFLIILIEL